MEICRDSYDQLGEVIHFNDWKTLVSLLVKMGFVDLYNGNIRLELETVERWGFSPTTGSRWYYRPDENGRIVCIGFVSRDGGLFDLPAGIHRLDQLRSDDAKHVKSLPMEQLCLLPQLKVLCVQGRSTLLSDSLSAQVLVKLPDLNLLYIGGSPSFHILHSCSALRYLKISTDEIGNFDSLLDILCSSELSFTGTLEKIGFSGEVCPMRGRHLETLLFRVAPRFPNLGKLSFDETLNIRSFKVLADRIRSDKSCIISKSLRHCILIGSMGM